MYLFFDTTPNDIAQETTANVVQCFGNVYYVVLCCFSVVTQLGSLANPVLC